MVSQPALVQTLLLDNYDSYTYNMYQMLAQVNGLEPVVFFNDAFGGDWNAAFAAFLERVEQVKLLHPHNEVHINIVLSPGPGTPTNASDFGLCAAAVLQSPTIPILGVCLGHQGMAHLYGGQVGPAPQVMHGMLSRIAVKSPNDAFFHEIPKTFDVVRYHSLIATNLPTDKLTVLATTTDGDIIMAFKHKQLNHYGVQFHPEAVCSQFGFQMLQNFRDLTTKAPCSSCKLLHTSSVPRMIVQPDKKKDKAYFTVVAAVEVAVDATVVFDKLFGKSRHAFWLDSSSGGGPNARFSYMGDASGPLSKYVAYDKWNETVTTSQGEELAKTHILDYLRGQLDHFAVEEATIDLPFDFCGGFVGYFGYEVLGVDSKSDLRVHPPDDMKVPDASFILADRVIVLDAQEPTVYLVAVTNDANKQVTQAWVDETKLHLQQLSLKHIDSTEQKPVDSSTPIIFTPSRTRATYEANIATILNKIQVGDTYEVCLTNQLVAEMHLESPLNFYKTLRRLNPAPFAGFLSTPDFAICSSSPERFISIDKSGAIESKPIKGTRKRCLDDLAEDANIAAELQSCVKDRAENMMIADLVRNDFGRVCVAGSIHIPKLMQVETFATVHQLVTTVRGQLRSDCNVVDAIHATFPGGSMTGAPKKRTMEIIRDVETHPRGVYSGALGYLSLNGAADLNIVIRTAVVTKNHITIGSGGAIVALSDVDDEYDEMLLKTKALRAALAAYCQRPVEVDVSRSFYEDH
ncbi:hypothetical protein LEN26_017978 [Aphanomyces euteiches]|nr:hypothetical protein LEN26_017978 [Aphanomyces euteiches]KAH9127568.1 hypothetical protein AeMF1_002149 [Aphanomyces euteiches]KAH9185758.1 hypothetical protein AeNC1_012261 [Aphanomyces euteiches]